jgi:GNAT superfamily N-acetyltransferase
LRLRATVGTQAPEHPGAFEGATRRRGIGTALLEAAIAHAAERGASAVELLVGRDNRVALDFYYGHGFRKGPLVCLRLPLRRGAAETVPPLALGAL